VNHVALLIPGLDHIGGAERQVILLAKGLLRRGWRVTVLALSGTGGTAAAELSKNGVGFLSLEMRKGLADPRGWIRFNRWLRQERPDVVHAHLPHAAWLARWSRLGLSAFQAPALIDTLHSSSTGAWRRRLGYRLSNWLPDKITAVSLAVAQTHLAAGMVSLGKLTVLPNGVDVDTWRPDAAVRREIGAGDEFLWLAVGRLDPVKDYATLLQAMTKLPERARLFIAGEGPLQDDLHQLSARLGLEHRVRFLGFEPSVKRWMQAADGFVLSSRWEGLPMALLEAAACALPAVATDVPGTREVISQGRTGWLTPAGDTDRLGEAMTAMMQTPPAERHAMGERARKRTIEQFSLETVLDRWERLYTELLGETHAEIDQGDVPLLEHFRKWCRPEFHWYPTLSAEKSGKDGARKSTAKAKML
jgi:glycosyltransferase involved in cell wall biosynthesis